MTENQLAAERAAFEEWFQSEQGNAYSGMWEFAVSAWLFRAAQAQREPVAEGEVARYALHRPSETMKFHREGEWVAYSAWQRTKAARLAAEDAVECLDKQIKQLTIIHKAGIDACGYLREQVEAQLAAERERSAKLVEALEQSRIMVTYSASGMTHAQWMTEQAIAILAVVDASLKAYQSSQENGK